MKNTPKCFKCTDEYNANKSECMECEYNTDCAQNCLVTWNAMIKEVCKPTN